MKGDYIPLAVGLLVFLASIISLRLGLSVAIIEIFLGAIAGNLGLKAEDWMIYIAQIGEGQAILPAFVLGLLMSKHFEEKPKTRVIKNRLRTVAYAFITPIFFIVGGMKISITMILASLGLFAALFAVKMVAKFVGVYFLAKKYIPGGSIYTTLLMSTGLTFGTISSLFGLQAGIINQVQYSILVGVVVASAIIPTFIAQKWFLPVDGEDILDFDKSIPGKGGIRGKA
jgi:Kef-type K+ transport system membrane component KefB